MRLLPQRIHESLFWLGFHYAPWFLSYSLGGRWWQFFIVLRWRDDAQGRRHNTVLLKWTMRYQHSFWLSWPRRDNLWARWRYEVFTRSGDRCIVWKVAEQKVCW
jgi:hypothetical protein